MRIPVTERRRRELNDQEQELLARTDSFWDLADAGYVSTRRTGSARQEIIGHKYVGRALAGDIELVVSEKARGTVGALISAATGTELRIERTESLATEFDMASRYLMSEFVAATGRYVAERRRPRYEYSAASGPVLGGTLDMARTARLHAVGRLEHLAYWEGRVVRDDPLDRVVLGALSELDRVGDALGLDASTLYDVRWIAGALDEVRDEAFLSLHTDDFLVLADGIERSDDTRAEDRDLARLSAVALLHQGFELDRETGGRVPRAWFIDLETLFEQAVRETLRGLLNPYDVDRGEALERWMFIGGEDRSRTNPDVVVHLNGAATGAGDVKYKTLRVGLGEGEDEEITNTGRDKKEGRSDLYQVLVHAASVGTDLAFLVFVSDDDYASRYLGEAATGCRTWTAQVRPTYLSEDLERFAHDMGLLPF